MRKTRQISVLNLHHGKGLMISHYGVPASCGDLFGHSWLETIPSCDGRMFRDPSDFYDCRKCILGTSKGFVIYALSACYVFEFGWFVTN